MTLFAIDTQPAAKQPQKVKKKGSTETAEESSLGLKIVVLASGAVLMSLEIVGSRLLAPHFGNSVYVWGSLISVFLIALSLGYWLGGHLADRKPSLAVLSGICIVVAALIFLIPWIGHPLCRWLLSVGVGEQSGPLVAATLLFLPASFLMGMVSPFSVRLTARNVQSVGRTAGSLYALSTIGSIVGTLGTTFVLIPFVGVAWILKCLGIVMILLPVVLAFLHRQKRGGIIAAVIVGFIGTSLHASPSFLLGSKQTLILDEDTPYHHVSVVDVGDQKRMLQFDQFVESSIKLHAPYPSMSEYTNYFHLAFLLQPQIKRTLFIGAGGGIGPTSFHTINPAMDIDVVDIDQHVLDIAANYFFMPQDSKIHPIAADGRMFFDRPTDKYDCVVLDAFTIGGKIPFHLTTREYFELIRSRMSPDGVFVMNLDCSITGEKSGIYRAISRTLKEVFPNLFVFANSITQLRDLSKFTNVILLATAKPSNLKKEDFLAAITGYPASSYITPDMLRSMVANLIESPPDNSGAIILTDDLAPVETM